MRMIDKYAVSEAAENLPSIVESVWATGMRST